MREFLAELKRRNVLRVAGVYAVVAWALLQGADKLFPILMLPPWTVTFVATLLLIGLPITMIITWAFEVSPSGIRRTAAVGEGEPGSGAGWFEGALLAAILVVIGLSVVQVLRREVVVTEGPAPSNAAREDPQAAAPAASIAVLPFTSFSEDPDSNYFADGLTEELINVLAQGGALKVSGRTSSFYFKNRNEDLREIGRQLGVAYVLEGSVRRAGDRLRITAQLVATGDGFHLWSQTYDRRLDDALAIQDDVAASVAAVLEARLVRQRERSHEPENHRQFLIAKGRLRDEGLESLTTSRALFADLMRREPDDPEVFAGYARATSILAGAYLTLDFDTAVAEARAAVEHALAVDPDSVAALVAAGGLATVIAYRSDEYRQLGKAEAYLARAVELAPDDPEVLTMYGTLLNEMERFDEAREVLERTTQRDPLSPAAQFQTNLALQGLGRLGEAKAHLESLIAIYPAAVGAKLELAELLVTQGQFEAALPLLESAHAARNTPRATFALAHLYLNVGLEEELQRTLAEIDYAPLAVRLAGVVRFNLDGDDAAALEYARAQFAQTRDPIWRPVMLTSAVLVGDVAAAREQLEALDPVLLEERPDTSRTEPEVALYAALLHRLEGRAATAAHVLEQIVARYAPPEQGYDAVRNKLIRAKAFAALGQREPALAELRAAYLQGFRTLWDFDQFRRLERLPMFARLREDPEFTAWVARIEADNARTRAHIVAPRAG